MTTYPSPPRGICFEFASVFKKTISKPSLKKCLDTVIPDSQSVNQFDREIKPDIKLCGQKKFFVVTIYFVG